MTSTSTSSRPTHKRHTPSISSRATSAVEMLYSARFMSSDAVTPSSATPTQRSPNTASRIMTTVRRSLSVSHAQAKRRQQDMSVSAIRSCREIVTDRITQSAGMYSTPEELSPPMSSRYQTSSPPPTIEQIAMGLHISRTPHLRPVTSRVSPSGSDHHVHANGSHRSMPVVLPPPPARSSLKKSSTDSSSAMPCLSTASSTTVASTTPSTPHSTGSLASLKTRMSRLLPGSRSSAPSPPESITEVSPPKKAVRFSTPPTPESS